jgi:hypothetical protein
MSMSRAAWWGAIVLVGLAGSGAVQAQAPAGYETEPVFEAKDLVAPELLQGPHFTVDPKVPVTGFIARFTIRSTYGEFSAHGLRMLPIRVNEIEAIAALDELSKWSEFVAAVGRAAVRPATSAVNMVIRPVETISGLPGGVTRLFGRVGLAGSRVVQAAAAPEQSGAERTAAASRRVGAATITALGFEQERRRLAERLGVDPYTTNPVLSERLTDVAWVAFSGRFAILAASAILVPYSMAMSATSISYRAVYDSPAADLVNNATAAFAQTGASRAQVQALVQNPQYSLSVLTTLARGIQRLKDLPGRDAVVLFAAEAQTQDEVGFVATSVDLLASYHESVAPLAKVSAPGPILGHTVAGSLALPVPADYVSWIEALRSDLDRPEFQASEKVAFITGRVSPLAQTNLTSRGWKISENFTTAAKR